MILVWLSLRFLIDRTHQIVGDLSLACITEPTGLDYFAAVLAFDSLNGILRKRQAFLPNPAFDLSYTHIARAGDLAHSGIRMFLQIVPYLLKLLVKLLPALRAQTF